MNRFLILVFSLVVFVTCKHLPTEEPVTPGGGTGNNNPPVNGLVCFNTQILPLIISNCANEAGCHSTVNTKEFVLMDYTKVRKIAAEGELMQVLLTSNLKKRMPYNKPPLDTAQINLIQRWIAEGMQNTVCVDDCDTLNVTYSKQIAPLMTSYCKGCHTGATAGGGVLLDSYANVKNQTLNGKVICTIYASGCNLMPKGGPALGFCNKRKLDLWKGAGCPQ